MLFKEYLIKNGYKFLNTDDYEYIPEDKRMAGIRYKHSHDPKIKSYPGRLRDFLLNTIGTKKKEE